MRFRSTWILLLVSAAGLLYYFLVEQPRHRRGVERRQGETRLTDIEPRDVTRLVIEGTLVTIELVRSDDEWRMTRPVQDRVELAAVNVMLRTVLDCTIERRLNPSPSRIADYGLDRPGAVVRIATPRESLLVKVGDFNMTKSSCYVVRDDEPEVLLVPAGLRRYAHQAAFEYRDKKVVGFRVADVTQLDITSPVRRLRWSKAENGRWWAYTGRDSIRGEPDEIEGILGGLRAMRANQLLPADGPNLVRLLSAPSGSVTAGLRGDSLAAFVFGRDSLGGCWVHDGSARIARVESAVLGIFAKTMHDLRDRRVVHFVADSLARITMEIRGRTTSIVRSSGDWSFVNPGLGAIDQSGVRLFLQRLENFKFREIVAERLPSPGVHGLDTPPFRLTLYDRRGNVVDRFAAGVTEPIRQLRFATSRSSGHLGSVDAEPVDELQSQFEDFRLQ